MISIKQHLDNGWNTTLIACCKGHTDIVNALLNQDTPLRIARTDNGKHHFMLHVKRQYRYSKCIVDESIDINKATTDDGQTPLLSACSQGHTDIVNALLSQESIDINKATTDDGWTPLSLCMLKGHTDIVNALLNQESIDMNKATTENGITPFYIACQEGHTDIVNALLSQESIDINKARTDNG